VLIFSEKAKDRQWRWRSYHQSRRSGYDAPSLRADQLSIIGSWRAAEYVLPEASGQAGTYTFIVLRESISDVVQQFFDYYDIIKKPMTLNQIKRKIGKDNYTPQAFRDDMHLVWDNARTYNQEDSWVYGAADDMQEYFDRLWEEETAKLGERESDTATTAAFEDKSALATAAGSGTSTPMYKAQDKLVLPTKIKLNFAKRKVVEPAATARLSAPQADNSDDSGSDDDEDDDDY
jgi:hypothetical protein